MKWTFEEILGVGLVAVLFATLIFGGTTSMKAKTDSAQTKATTKMDSVATQYN